MLDLSLGIEEMLSSVRAGTKSILWPAVQILAGQLKQQRKTGVGGKLTDCKTASQRNLLYLKQSSWNNKKSQKAII